MGRKKKVGLTKVIPTRSRRLSSKSKESSNTGDINWVDSDNTSVSQDYFAENDSQDANIAPLTHKKFGKFRCLLLNENKTTSGHSDDSETGSNVEVRVVDPCASSESGSNSPAYVPPHLKDLRTFSKGDANSKPSTSKGISSIKKPCDIASATNNYTIDCSSSDADSKINLNSVMEFDTQIPDPTLDIISKCDPRHGTLVDELSSLYPATHGIDENGDDEMMTVFEIIDENGSDNMFYEMKTDDRIFSDSADSSDRIAVVMSSDSNNSSKIDLNNEYPHYNVDAQALTDFESKMSEIHIKSIGYDDSDDKNLRNNFKSDSKEVPSKSVNSSPLILDTNKMEDSSSKSNDSEAVTSSSASAPGVRRSTRIKTISDLKQKSKGRGLVKSSKKVETPLVKEVLVKVSEAMSESSKTSDSNPSSPSHVGLPLSSPSVHGIEMEPKPVKVKSRWRRSSEMEMGGYSPVTPPLQSPNSNSGKLATWVQNATHKQDSNSLDNKIEEATSQECEEELQKRLKQFDALNENEYHCDRTISKEARKMTCDCFLTKDEIERGELGCGEDCLNRLLMIECNSRCPVGDRCTNRRFQNRQYSKLRVMKTDKKGLGLQAGSFIPSGEFLMEYVGEVLNSKQFNQRAEEYSSTDKNIHHYFMALKGDAVIDATLKGNISRFINHSCDPNSETQKWTVNGELRIGFFSKRDINCGEEVTFDYQFQRYGKEAQKCYCEASNCRGWIGEEPESESEEEEEEDDKEVVEKTPVETPVKTEVEEGVVPPIEIKEEVKLEKTETEVVEDQSVKTPTLTRPKKKDKPKKFARAAKELLEDLDLAEDMEMLSRSGIKNQSHTLSLCRAMVRAKRESARTTLLALLAAADLPCRRLFLDYRGLRLLAPWCHDANANFRLNMLIALEKLPIPNKTILQECNLITYLEKWLSSATYIMNSSNEDSDSSSCAISPVLIDQHTGLPVEVPPRLEYKVDQSTKAEKSSDVNSVVNKREEFYYSQEQKDKIGKLCKLLLDRWAQLKEVFRIPKKERIEIMKEHERQANEPHTKKEFDKDGVKIRKTRWEERYTRPERPERPSDTTKDKKRPRPPSPDSFRKIKLDDRSPLSKEERRREFAERAAREEKMKKATPPSLLQDSGAKKPLLSLPPTWMPPPEYNMPFAPMMMSGMPPPDFSMPRGIPANYMPMDYVQQKPFMLPFYGPPQPMFMPPQAFPPMMGPRPPFPPGSNNFPNIGPPPTPNNFPNIGPPPVGMLPPTIMPPQGVTALPPSSTFSPMASLNPQPLLNCPLPCNIPRPQTPPLPHPTATISNPEIPKLPLSNIPNISTGYSQVVQDTSSVLVSRDAAANQNVSTPTDENQEIENDVVVPFAPVRLPQFWRSVKDVRGRTYYYHVKLRVPQWEPPLYSPTPNSKEDESSSSENESSEEEGKNMEDGEKGTKEKYSKEKFVEGVNGIYKVDMPSLNGEVSGFTKKVKKIRPGLITGCWIISPRKEEDRIANQLELKRYKENKEKLRRRKEQALLAAAHNEAIIKYKKKLKERKKSKKKESELVADESARRRKEVFTVNMAKVMVQHLNPFRRDDCPLGRITNTADFKHLAKKLTHFVMLKELKHKDVNDLECSESVKQKAKEFVKKYMAKFGPTYIRAPEEVD